MDLAVFGNQVNKEKPKSGRSEVDSQANSSRSVKSNQSKRSHTSANSFQKPTSDVRNFCITPSNLTTRSKSSSTKSSARGMGSFKKPNNVSGNRTSSRTGDMNLFLDLKVSEDDDVKRELSNKHNNRRDMEWEEISISSGIKSKENSSSRVLPICKKAFESESYPKFEGFEVNENRDLESQWSESIKSISARGDATDRTLTHINTVSVKENCSKIRNQAACKIQNWFKRHRNRRKMAEAAMKRMLSEKQQEMKNTVSPMELFDSVKKNVPSSRTSLIINSNPQSVDRNKMNHQSTQSIQSVAKKEDANNNKLSDTPKKSNTKEVSRPFTAKSRTSQQNSARSIADRKTNPISSNSTPRISVTDSARSKPPSIITATSVSQRNRLDADSNSISKVHDDVDSSTLCSDSNHRMTTIDDILSTIKQLESVECLTDRSQSISNQNQNSHGWNQITNDIEKLLQPTHLSPSDYLSRESNHKLTKASLDLHNQSVNSMSTGEMSNNAKVNNAVNDSTLVSDAKFNNILKFLNEVDVSKQIESSFHQHQAQNIKSSNVGQNYLEESSQSALNEVSSKLSTLRLELEEKKRSQDMLQKALQQQRELTVRQVKETQRDMEKRLESQREEYESALQRNHTFIDQLINKNELLQDKLNKLLLELKEKSEKYEEKIRNLQDSHSVEMKKVDAKHAAGEKIRREKWEAEKTKLIKEMTIKGMETEIAQLIAGQKQELRKVKQYYENELSKLEESSYDKYNKQIEELRKQLFREKEDAIQKEQDSAKERFEQEMQRQVQILECQRRQLYQEISDERERLNLLTNKQKSEMDNLRKRLENKEDELGESLRLKHQHELEDIKRKYDTEIRDLKSQYSLEQQIWTETQKKQNEALLLTREQELRQEMKRKRDEEIEKVIDQLEKDHNQTKIDLDNQYANKIKRLKDKYEAEINELENSEKLAKEKYSHIRTDYLELEGEHESIKVIMKQKEKEIEEVKQLYETLHREREHVSDIIRQEFADRLVSTEEENRRFKREQSELKAKLTYTQKTQEEELERLRNKHQLDLAEVHEKVKEAIKRKEENMTDLRTQFQQEASQWQEKINAADKRSEHLESLLEQQRKQLLKLK